MRRLLKNACVLAWERGAFKTIPRGWVGIDGDTIVCVGPERPEGEWDEEKDLTGRILMPGLVNCHCHAAMVLLRGVGSDLPLDRWLYEEMFPVEGRLTADEIGAGNELAMMEMIAGGITSFSDMYMEPQTMIASNAAIGMKVNLCRVVQAFDPNEKAEDSQRIRESLALFESAHGAQSGRIRVDFAVHAEYTINDDVAAGYARRVRPYLERGARMQIHLSETKKEHDECVARHGLTPAAWCEEMGLFDVPASAAHCVAVTDADLEILKRCGVSPIHNPTSNLKLGSGFAPIPRMLEMGLNVTLGTDGAASNNNLNLFEEMHLSAIMHNGYHNDAVILPPETVLKMATINGARLQGRDDTGAIEAGRKADLIAVDTRGKAHLYPAFDVPAILTYACQASDVSMTMVDGKILYEDGRFLTLDPDRVLKNARRAVETLYGADKKSVT